MKIACVLNALTFAGLETYLWSVVSCFYEHSFTFFIRDREMVDPECLRVTQEKGITVSYFLNSSQLDRFDRIIVNNQMSSFVAPANRSICIYHGYPFARRYWNKTGLPTYSVNPEGTAYLVKNFDQPNLCLYPCVDTALDRSKTIYNRLEKKKVIQIGSMASSRPEKHSDYLVEFLNSLTSIYSFEFSFLGGKIHESRYSKARFVNHLLPCENNRSRLNDFLLGLDIFLYSVGVREGWCLAVSEAMKVGLPIMADGIGGIAYQLREDRGCMFSYDLDRDLEEFNKLFSKNSEYGKRAKGWAVSFLSAERFRKRFKKALLL